VEYDSRTTTQEISSIVERQDDGCFADTRPSESQRRLSEAAQDVYALVEQFRQGEAASLDSEEFRDR
jgi:hypothetical protein